MNCRPACAACCIAPSITTPMPNMPNGKPAGQACANLDDDLNCILWGQANYPKHCGEFKACEENCGSDREQALQLITYWEEATS